VTFSLLPSSAHCQRKTFITSQAATHYGNLAPSPSPIVPIPNSQYDEKAKNEKKLPIGRIPRKEESSVARILLSYLSLRLMLWNWYFYTFLQQLYILMCKIGNIYLI
jgi:hypothetical protein